MRKTIFILSFPRQFVAMVPLDLLMQKKRNAPPLPRQLVKLPTLEHLVSLYASAPRKDFQHSSTLSQDL